MRKAPKLPICQDYELYNGNPVAVLYRDKTSDKTEPCPFCAKIHHHGYPDGHRNTHCSDNITYKRGRYCDIEVKLTPEEIKSLDGTILKREHGYIIRTRPNQDTKEELISLAVTIVEILDIRAKANHQNNIQMDIDWLISKAKRILQTYN